MLNRPLSLVMAVILFALVTSAARPIVAHPKYSVIGDKEKDWNEIIQLWNKGKLLVAEGLSNGYKDKKVWEQQVEIFSQAAPKLTAWIDNYISDKNSVTYLKNTYRLGNYWEYAGNWRAAQNSYKICSKHVLLNTPQAKYGGKALKQLVEERLRKIELALDSAKTKRISRPGWILVQIGSSQALHEKPDLDAVFPPAPIDDVEHY